MRWQEIISQFNVFATFWKEAVLFRVEDSSRPKQLVTSNSNKVTMRQPFE